MMTKQQCALVVSKGALCLVLLFLLTGRSAAGRVSTALRTADVDNQVLVENEGANGLLWLQVHPLASRHIPPFYAAC